MKITKSFESWYEWVNYLATTPAHPNNRSLDSHYSGNHGWYKTDSFEDAIELAKTGWSEGAAKIKSLSAMVATKISNLIEKQELYLNTYSPFGTYDMAAVVSGHPENAINFTTTLVQESGEKIKHVVISGGASATVEADAVINRGVIIVSFINAMELAGFRIKLSLSYNNSNKSSHTIVLKQPSEDLDIPFLAFAIAHPSALRRLELRAQEIDGLNLFAYGMPYESIEQGDVYFGRTHGITTDWGRYSNLESSAAFVTDLLRKQGVVTSN